MAYTKSKKRINRDKKQSDWERRMFIFIKRNQGLTFEEIAKKLKVSRQSVCETYSKIEKMTIEELENEYNNWCLTDNK